LRFLLITFGKSWKYDPWWAIVTKEELMKKLLLVFALLALVVTISVAQDWELDPSYDVIELEGGFLPDPFTMEVLAGGSVDLETSSVRGVRNLDAYGYVAEAPDVNFYYDTDGDFPLTIRVNGFGEDVVLLINDPDGNWHYNDDDVGINPGINFRKPKSGLYSIWIGTYFNDDYLDAELSITEM